MKIAFFIFWAALTVWESRQLRETKRRDRLVFWCLTFLALAAGAAYAALPDAAGLAEWLIRQGENAA